MLSFSATRTTGGVTLHRPNARGAKTFVCQAVSTNRASLKAELLEEAKRVERGVSATEEDKEKIEKLVQSLEKLNPNPNSLDAREINGRWLLVYTTSETVLGTKRLPLFRPTGPIYQTVGYVADVKNLKVRNNETWPVYNAVTANATPVSKSQINVQFQEFRIGNIIPFKAPSRFKGSLDTTYVDEDLRISRGDLGNLFVLVMDDPTATLEGQP